MVLTYFRMCAWELRGCIRAQKCTRIMMNHPVHADRANPLAVMTSWRRTISAAENLSFFIFGARGVAPLKLLIVAGCNHSGHPISFESSSRKFWRLGTFFEMCAVAANILRNFDVSVSAKRHLMTTLIFARLSSASNAAPKNVTLMMFQILEMSD